MLGVFHGDMIWKQHHRRLAEKRQQYPAFIAFDVDFQNMHDRHIADLQNVQRRTDPNHGTLYRTNPTATEIPVQLAVLEVTAGLRRSQTTDSGRAVSNGPLRHSFPTSRQSWSRPPIRCCSTAPSTITPSSRRAPSVSARRLSSRPLSRHARSRSAAARRADRHAGPRDRLDGVVATVDLQA